MGIFNLFKQKETDAERFEKYLKRETAIAKAARRASGISPIEELKTQIESLNEMRGMFSDMEADRQDEIMKMLDQENEKPEDQMLKTVLPLLLGGKQAPNPTLNPQIVPPTAINLQELNDTEISIIDKEILAKIPKASKILIKTIPPAKQESALFYILNKLRN